MKLLHLWLKPDLLSRRDGETAVARGPHVHGSVDLRRIMLLVLMALLPAMLAGIYNAGYQSAGAPAPGEGNLPGNWRIFADGTSLALPLILVSILTAGAWEILFSIVRRRPMTEAFLVTAFLFPLTLPPGFSLWRVALGISFGIVMGKEIFGGTGRNFLNPALTGRLFLFFAFPGDLARATNLPLPAYPVAPTGPGILPFVDKLLHGIGLQDHLLWNMAWGLMPGNLGETSTIAILVGAAILVLTGVGSREIILSTIAGGLLASGWLHLYGGAMFAIPMVLSPLHQILTGGFLFGAVFMATDPVTGTATLPGKYIYGLLIGILAILLQTWNPARQEGMMLAILVMNVFAPLIDWAVVRIHVRRRSRRLRAFGNSGGIP